MNEWKKYGLPGTLMVLLFLGCEDKKTLFTALSPDKTGVDFINQIVESDSFNINQYLYAYNGAGLALGDVNNDGLTDVYFGANQSANRLFLNRGNFRFEEVTETAGVRGWSGPEYWTTGVSMVDINHDGWLDIYVNQVVSVSHLKGHNLLFINNQDGSFSEQSRKYGLDVQTFAQQTAFFDYDLDGDLDAYLLNHSLHELDVYVKTVNRDQRDPLAGDRLLRNDGGFFREVSEEAGIYGSPTGYGLAVSIGDLDNNGCPDIYVSNDFHENDYLYLNQCDGTFKEGLREVLPYCSTFSMGSDMADINNDGWLDLMTLDMKPEDEIIRKTAAGADPYDIFNYKLSFGYAEQYPRNMLHINQGTVRDEPLWFSEIAQQLGIDATDWSWSVLLADLDNDRYKDLYITNGIYRRPNDLDYINYTFHEAQQKNISSLEIISLMPDGKAKNYAYRNRGGWHFENVSEAWGLDLDAYSMGSAYADLDNDGDLDLVVNNLNTPSVIYRNNTDTQLTNNYLSVKLVGPEQNRFGIGTRVVLFTAGQSFVQELNPVRGWLSSCDYKLIFGLGEQKIVDSLIIHWAGGTGQSFYAVPANQTLTVTYREAEPLERGSVSPMPLLEPVPDPCGLRFTHLENDYVDFDRELLLPRGLSREGPGLAIGDLNGDHREDLFIGGAAGHAGAIFLSDPGKSQFVRRLPRVFLEDREKEDVEAALLDADGDGDLDLYVVSGGSQRKTGEESTDRLYLNDGLGDFTRSPYLPPITSNGSCVVAADFDDDGHTDLFVGSRSVVGNYGYAPDAFLLWNRGGGKFEKDTSTYVSSLQSLGMLTDAVWDHQTRRLFVVGEFMPVTYFEFPGESLVKKTLDNSNGWWNTIYALDVDQDGDLDFLAGNNGLNSPLRPTPEEPVRLIVKDWDNNGQSDPLLTHVRQGKEWLYHGLDDIKKQIPAIRLRFNDYHLYAEHSLERTFSEADLQTADLLRATTFESALILNEGEDRYSLISLPAEVQASPVFSFQALDIDGDQHLDILAMGNASTNTPSIGNQKASAGFLLKGLGGNKFHAVSLRESGLRILGDVRDIGLIDVQSGQWIVVAKNDDFLELWRRARNDNEALQ